MNMKKIIYLISLMAVGSFSAFANEDFNLNSIKAESIVSNDTSLEIPEPAFTTENLNFAKAPNVQPALDLSLKLPFKEINKRLAEMDISRVRAINPAQPILSKKNESLIFENIVIDYNGMDVEPYITLKPYFEANNKLAIKIQKIEMDVAFGPSKSLNFQQINKNEVMALAMEEITQAIKKAMDEALIKNKVPLKSKDLVAFAYEKETWILHIAINPTFISPLMPGLINNINLSAFGFDNEGFTIKAGFNSELIPPNPLYNLSLSDGLITNFIKKFSDGGDFEILPEGHKGGVKFRQDGKIELSGKMKVRDMLLKPNVYFTVEIKPMLISQNIIRIHFERINVDQAYGIGMPGFLNNWLQNKIISSTVNAITTNPELQKNMSARKIDDKTIEINLNNTAFLPSFIKGVKINGMKIALGLMYLAFEF